MSIREVLGEVHRGFRFCFLYGGIAAAASMDVAAHDDLDLGIESVTLDKKCKARVVIKNYGHDLPPSFYGTVNPAFVTIKKGDTVETLKSLRALDRRKQLQPLGGSIVITSKKTFANIPEAIYLNTHYADEFGDYGAGNNSKVESMDCHIGTGQVAGAPIVYTQPDVAISDARIDPKSCKIHIELTNLTGIPLHATSWIPEQGVTVMQLNLDTNERAADIPLIELDPDRVFGRVTQNVTWESELPFKAANKMRVGLWRVLGDLDFSNNSVELAVPNTCIEAKGQ